MEKVQEITLVVRVEDQDEQRVQADFAMDGYGECDKRIMFVPGQINQEDLSECMLRGYWDEFERHLVGRHEVRLRGDAQ